MRCWSISVEINRAQNHAEPPGSCREDDAIERSARVTRGKSREHARRWEEGKETRRNRRSVCGAIAPRRDVCTGIYQGLSGGVRWCIFVKKGLTTLCHAGISGVGAQTLLCSARARYTRVGHFFLFFFLFFFLYALR